MFDLNNLSLKELRDLRTKVDRSIAGFEERKRREAMAALEDAAREHGFSLSELTGAKASRRGTKVAAKYNIKGREFATTIKETAKMLIKNPTEYDEELTYIQNL